MKLSFPLQGLFLVHVHVASNFTKGCSTDVHEACVAVLLTHTSTSIHKKYVQIHLPTCMHPHVVLHS